MFPADSAFIRFWDSWLVYIPLWEKNIRSNRGEADLTFDTPEEADLSRDIIAISVQTGGTVL